MQQLMEMGVKEREVIPWWERSKTVEKNVAMKLARDEQEMDIDQWQGAYACRGFEQADNGILKLDKRWSRQWR